jgi:hypothetical protein
LDDHGIRSIFVLSRTKRDQIFACI